MFMLGHPAKLTSHGPRLVASVRLAISQGTHPRLNAKGSSGSYFVRAPPAETVGVFKPADEEPYGTLNPKMVKVRSSSGSRSRLILKHERH